MRAKEEIGRFFTFLSDEIYHTFQYLRRRRGILPGERVSLIHNALRMLELEYGLLEAALYLHIRDHQAGNTGRDQQIYP